ncbi:helix-turn-helix domain-containing protein [Streptomyces sp. H27-H5]|nr:helix-turn-helix domain-containing protein [Streptomyces sp. H27-H5]
MLARGLSVLRCFRPGEPELQLSEIARRADMPKATAHRIISELVEEGMLERGERGLRLGVALFALGARVPRQLTLRSRDCFGRPVSCGDVVRGGPAGPVD